MTIREFDRMTIFAQESYTSPYGKLNCIAELRICLPLVAVFSSGVKELGRKVDPPPPPNVVPKVRMSRSIPPSPPVWLHVVDMDSTCSTRCEVLDISTV